MKAYRSLVGAIAVLLISVSAMQASAEYTLSEDVIFAEGVDMHGADVVANPTEVPYTEVGPANNVQVDWSDNIVFHQFPAGAKVRTEVILHDMNVDGSQGPAVFTLTAHLKIIATDGPGTAQNGLALYESNIYEGVFADGRNDYYSAEVNELGYLLYGYNWDTRAMSCGEGWYRLIFWLAVDEDYSETNPITGTPITYNTVDITSGAPGDVDPESGTIYGLVGVDTENDVTWIDIYLAGKPNGRGSSGSAHWNP
jgi:hypothetical protein